MPVETIEMTGIAATSVVERDKDNRRGWPRR